MTTKDRPILMNRDMVRATLREINPKRQTRRLVQVSGLTFLTGQGSDRDNPGNWGYENDNGEYATLPSDHADAHSDYQIPCPLGQVGDRLWVRETARVIAVRSGSREIDVKYEVDGSEATVAYPARLAPAPLGKCLANGTYREASRITLEITSVRVERLHAITETDALSEGVDPGKVTSFCNGWPTCDCPARFAFREIWLACYGPENWEANPFVWVISFRRSTP